jgi:hypothetical protein
MIDIESARILVRDWPVTVERYNSGQLGFCARPMVNGRRFNKNFALSKWGTPEQAASAAIRFCQETLQKHGAGRSGIHSPIPPNTMTQLETIYEEAKTRGIDLIEVIRRGMRITLKEMATALTLSQAVQKYLIFQAEKGFKEGYLHDLKGFYSSFEMDYGSRKMADITTQDVEEWLARRLSQKAVRSPVTWNTWRRKLELLWDFALLPERGWVAENVIVKVPEK